jgi:salicylate hydroxylase
MAAVDGPGVRSALDGTVPAAPGELVGYFAGWSPSLLQLPAATEQSDRWALFTQTPLSRWVRGRAVLIGDAAQAMLPYHGQGANQSIEDAIVLANALAGIPRGEHAVAFERYQHARRARVDLIQRSSLDEAAVLHLPDGPAATTCNSALRDVANQLAWVRDHDVQQPDRDRGTRVGEIRKQTFQVL